jgi:hypothetical protein
MFPDLTVSQWIVLVCSVLTVGVLLGTLGFCISTARICREIDSIADETSRVNADTRRLMERNRSDA